MKKKIIIVLCGVILVSVLALAGAFMIFNNKPTAKSDEACLLYTSDAADEL